MENEKLLILKMLEDGRITADEAARLLEAAGRGTHAKEAPKPGTPPFTARPDAKAEAPRSNAGGGGSTASKSDMSFKEFTGDLGGKFNTISKTLEPKLQRASQAVMKGTLNLADKLSQTISDVTKETTRPPKPASTPTTPASSFIREFELVVPQGNNELHLSALNGPLRLKGYNGNKITLKINCKSTPFDCPISLTQLGNKFTLLYDEREFEFVSVEGYVPSHLFNMLVLQVINGNLDVSDMVCANAHIDNFNSQVSMNNMDIGQLKLVTANGGIHCNVSQFSAFSNYNWSAETSNAQLTMNMPSNAAYGYHIRAHASLGSVKVGLTNMNYLASDASNVEAKSIGYDAAQKHIMLQLETSGAAVVVN